MNVAERLLLRQAYEQAKTCYEAIGYVCNRVPVEADDGNAKKAVNRLARELDAHQKSLGEWLCAESKERP